MNVLVNNQGERVRIYRPYINREDESLGVSIFVPESSTNVGLYDWEQVNHLNGESPAGLFTDEVYNAGYWWGMKPFATREPPCSLAAQQPGVYANPTNFYRPQMLMAPPRYLTMTNVYGGKPMVGHTSKMSASYGGM